MKKYELTDDSITYMGRKLFRIRALISFNDVKTGDLGGYVEREENLSHHGNSWVYDNARVYGDAWVCGNAWVCGDARIFGELRILMYDRVCENTQVSEIAEKQKLWYGRKRKK